MKMNIFNNRTYDIIDDIKIKLSSGNRTKIESFEMMAGKYKLNCSYHNKSMKQITLFLPQYASQLFSMEPVIRKGNVNYLKLIMTSDDLSHPLDINSKKLKLYDNGLYISPNDNITVHTASFFDKVVGFLFLLDK